MPISPIDCTSKETARFLTVQTLRSRVAGLPVTAAIANAPAADERLPALQNSAHATTPMGRLAAPNIGWRHCRIASAWSG